MRKKIIINVLYSFVEKFASIGAQFILSIIIIRLLSREDYGIIGAVVGYFVFVNFLNISIESIILRDHKKISENLKGYFSNFFIFNIIKSMLILIVSILIGLYLIKTKDNINYMYAIISYASIFISDSIVAPILVYTTANLNQKMVTKFTAIKILLNLFLSVGLLIYPSLTYLALKDIIVSSVYIFIWFFYFSITYKLSNVFNFKYFNFNFIKKTILEYSLWTHLNGVVTMFIYKSDIFFLSLFHNLKIVGDYNIALTAANVANIIPMIIAYQNSIAISHAEDNVQANYISNKFLRVSLIVGFISILVFVFGGNLYLKMITGQNDNTNIYSYMIPIVFGLIIVKTIASPLNSYINIKGSVKGLFKSVLLPTFIFTALSYFISAYMFDALTVARVNIINSLVWLILIIRYTKKHKYSFRSILDVKRF